MLRRTLRKKIASSEFLGEDKPETLLDQYRQDYEDALTAIDHTAKELIEQGKEATALTLIDSSFRQIGKIHDSLSHLYQLFYRYRKALQRHRSQRYKECGRRLLPLTANLKSPQAVEEAMENLKREGWERDHWLLRPWVLMEIEYMLDVLEVLVEPEFIPLEVPSGDGSDERPDRYIHSSVKMYVWRRDGGKCVECGSRENLEYDHIIPVSKGGSNTERNIQLLCEKCNRQKAAQIM